MVEETRSARSSTIRIDFSLRTLEDLLTQTAGSMTITA